MQTTHKTASPALEEVTTGNTDDTITVLQCMANHRATKTISRDADGSIKIKPYQAGLRFVAHPLHIRTIDDLSRVLGSLEQRPDMFVIRGVLRRGVDGSLVLRRSSTSDAPFQPASHFWLALDFDEVPEPQGVHFCDEPERCVLHVMSMLPPEFSQVTVHWRASASAGFKPGIRVHLWFVSAAPLSDIDLRRWAKFINGRAGRKLVDSQLYKAVQPHYTAQPILVGLADPMVRRSGVIRGARDTVTLTLPRGETRPAPIASPIEAGDLPAGDDGRKLDGRNVGGMLIRFQVYQDLLDERGRVDFEEFVTESYSRFLREYAPWATPHSANEYTPERWREICQPDYERLQGKIGSAARLIDGIHPEVAARTTVSLNEGERRLEVAVKAYLDRPAHTLISVTPGVGKTSFALNAIAKKAEREPDAVFEIHVPSHDLATELMDKCKALGIEALHLQGITRPGMCLRPNIAELVDRLVEIGMPVTTTLCGTEEAPCPHREACEYRRQRKQESRVIIGTHTHLVLPRERKV